MLCVFSLPWPNFSESPKEEGGGEGEGDHTPDIPINFHLRHFVRAIGTRMHLKSVKMPESFLWKHPPSESSITSLRCISVFYFKRSWHNSQGDRIFFTTLHQLLRSQFPDPDPLSVTISFSWIDFFGILFPANWWRGVNVNLLQGEWHRFSTGECIP